MDLVERVQEFEGYKLWIHPAPGKNLHDITDSRQAKIQTTKGEVHRTNFVTINSIRQAMAKDEETGRRVFGTYYAKPGNMTIMKLGYTNLDVRATIDALIEELSIYGFLRDVEPIASPQELAELKQNFSGYRLMIEDIVAPEIEYPPGKKFDLDTLGTEGVPVTAIDEFLDSLEDLTKELDVPPGHIRAYKYISRDNVVQIDITTNDGERFWTNLVTIPYLEWVMQKNSETGECLDGTYYGISDNMIVMRDGYTHRDIVNMIGDLIERGEINYFLNAYDDYD